MDDIRGYLQSKINGIDTVLVNQGETNRIACVMSSFIICVFIRNARIEKLGGKQKRTQKGQNE